jgi:hypothetical protein
MSRSNRRLRNGWASVAAVLFFACGAKSAMALALCELSGSSDDITAYISTETGIKIARDVDHCSLEKNVERCRWSLDGINLQVTEDPTTHIIGIRVAEDSAGRDRRARDNVLFRAPFNAIRSFGVRIDSQVLESISAAIGSGTDANISHQGLCMLYYISISSKRVLNFIGAVQAK